MLTTKAAALAGWMSSRLGRLPIAVRHATAASLRATSVTSASRVTAASVANEVRDHARLISPP